MKWFGSNFFDRKHAEDNGTSRHLALDAITTNVMIADENYTIVSMNAPLREFLAAAEPEIREQLPQFSVARLVGQNIDIFHKSPAHQRQVLDGLTKPHRATINVGKRLFDLQVAPLFSHGKRIGTAVEWTDAALRLQAADYAAQIQAFGRSQAVIEFAMDGTIANANRTFLDLFGYPLEEIKGKHHRIFAREHERNSPDYEIMWATLRRGEFIAREFVRVAKTGKEIWIQGSYNPILDHSGKPIKVVKFAHDVTAQRMQAVNHQGQVDAIHKSNLVIEYNLDGTIIEANHNALAAMGYQSAEIAGRHHGIFMPHGEADSRAYREFWATLNRGEFREGEFRLLRKDGRDVWLQASYNPIFDLNGKPYKVVQFASDVTEQTLARMRSQKVGEMMENVAAGAEELSVSVREISSTMLKSAETAREAAQRVESTAKSAQRLARAGEAGRGFAVVANEVKNLATQARTATEQISREIGELREISAAVVGELDAIKHATDNVLDFVSSTASAVEEQSAVTAQMSDNMQTAAFEAGKIGAAA